MYQQSSSLSTSSSLCSASDSSCSTNVAAVRDFDGDRPTTSCCFDTSSSNGNEVRYYNNYNNNYNNDDENDHTNTLYSQFNYERGASNPDCAQQYYNCYNIVPSSYSSTEPSADLNAKYLQSNYANNAAYNRTSQQMYNYQRELLDHKLYPSTAESTTTAIGSSNLNSNGISSKNRSGEHDNHDQYHYHSQHSRCGQPDLNYYNPLVNTNQTQDQYDYDNNNDNYNSLQAQYSQHNNHPNVNLIDCGQQQLSYYHESNRLSQVANETTQMQTVSNYDGFDDNCQLPASSTNPPHQDDTSVITNLGCQIIDWQQTNDKSTRQSNCKNNKLKRTACNDADSTLLDHQCFLPTITHISSNVNKMNKCSICGRNYARPSTLKTHLRTHTNEKPFKCQICQKTFSQAANLTAHQRVHTGERPFSCPICGRQFSQSSSVITHLRTHSGERPYRCNICDRTFSDSSTLTKHCRIHSGEKPYQCNYCPLNFSQSGNLSRHLKLHFISSSSTSASSTAPTIDRNDPNNNYDTD